MTQHYTLQAQSREKAGKGTSRALRLDNKIPAVIYGNKEAPIMVSLPEKETTFEYLKGHMTTTLCDLNVDGKKQLVIVRDVQTHPVSDRIIHVDFLRISEKTTIRVAVPVHFKNQETSPGMKNGGLLNIVLHEITLECPANAIPSEISFDISNANIGDAIHMTKADLPKGCRVVDHDEEEFTVATIAQPRVSANAEGEAAEGGEATPA
jgi:large subunit ribosomal protein L25